MTPGGGSGREGGHAGPARQTREPSGVAADSWGRSRAATVGGRQRAVRATDAGGAVLPNPPGPAAVEAAAEGGGSGTAARRPGSRPADVSGRKTLAAEGARRTARPEPVTRSRALSEGRAGGRGAGPPRRTGRASPRLLGPRRHRVLGPRTSRRAPTSAMRGDPAVTCARRPG